MTARILKPLGAGLRGIYVGRARLYGTTKNAGNPDAPVQRRVVLYVARPLTPVAAVISDAVTGSWEVRGLPDLPERYAVIAYDHTGQYDPVMKTNLLPTVD